MKKAKVVKGIVQKVWPWEKTLPDGTKVIKEYKDHHAAKGLPTPDHIVDVPDEVQVNWIWDGEKYRPRTRDVLWVKHPDGTKFVSKPLPKPKKDYFMELIAEKLGTTVEALQEEARRRKQEDLNKE